MNTESRTMADALRIAADFLAEHPDLPLPYVTTTGDPAGCVVELNWFLTVGGADLAEQKSLAAQIVSTVDGTWTKIPDTYREFFFRQRREGLHLDVAVAREAVCERIVTGTELVTVPAVAAQPERTEEREVVEWRCEPLLAEAVSA